MREEELQLIAKLQLIVKGCSNEDDTLTQSHLCHIKVTAHIGVEHIMQLVRGDVKEGLPDVLHCSIVDKDVKPEGDNGGEKQHM
jgi:hypothetical protein